MLYNKKISLIIPCKNEESALYSLLNKVPSYVDEIIVIDNNSSDNTAYIGKVHGAKVFIEKRQEGGIGYGYAHQTGMKKATGDYIIAMDGDNTYPTQSISEVITYMEKNHLDFVSCNRLPLSEKQAISGFRQMGIKILNFWIALLYGYYFLDILTGMWVMNRKALNKLNVKSGDWNFSPEIKLAALSNREISFSEYHIPYFVRVNGRSKLNAVKTGLSHCVFVFQNRTHYFAFKTIRSVKTALSYIF